MNESLEAYQYGILFTNSGVKEEATRVEDQYNIAPSPTCTSMIPTDRRMLQSYKLFNIHTHLPLLPEKDQSSTFLSHRNHSLSDIKALITADGHIAKTKTQIPVHLAICTIDLYRNLADIPQRRDVV